MLILVTQLNIVLIPCLIKLFSNRHMATPPNSPPPPPESATPSSPTTTKKTRKATRLRSLATRPAGVERPVILVDLVTKKADGPHRKKLRTNLGIFAQKDMIWEDIQVFQLNVECCCNMLY